jgi:hypothetical protein
MQVTVLKAFPYSTDGKTSIMLMAGDTPDIRDELVPGLKSEGYVDCPGVAAAPYTAERRQRLIERIIAAGRRQLEAAPDEQLAQAIGAIEAQEVRAAGLRAAETKVIEAAPETGAPVEQESTLGPAIAEPPLDTPVEAEAAPEPSSEAPEAAAPARRQRKQAGE